MNRIIDLIIMVLVTDSLFICYLEPLFYIVIMMAKALPLKYLMIVLPDDL